MADFLSNLWSSIFTPGTTPTLLVATNATFAALQTVLFALLVATRSIHFAILTVLCAGLWWSINWFAAELKAAQAKEDEAEKLRKRKKGESQWRRKGDVEDSADDEGEDTEVEEGRTGLKGSVGDLGGGDGKGEEGRIRDAIRDAMKSSPGQGGESSSGVGTGAQPQAGGGAEVRQRVVEDVDRSGEISTDSEWEKVSQSGEN